MLHEKVNLASDFTLGTNYADVTGMYLKIPKDGFYTIESVLTIKAMAPSSTDPIIFTQLTINGTANPVMMCYYRGLYSDKAASSQNISPVLKSFHPIMLKKNDIVQLQGKCNVGSNLIMGTGTTYCSFISYYEYDSKLKSEFVYNNTQVTLGASYADISGFVLKIPKDGFYKLSYSIPIQTRTSTSGTNYSYTKMQLNGVDILPSFSGIYNGTSANSSYLFQDVSKFCYLKLNKNDIITFQAKRSTIGEVSAVYGYMGYTEIDIKKVNMNFLAADYSSTTSYADVPGGYFKIPKDGFYKVFYNAYGCIARTNTGAFTGFCQITLNGTIVPNSISSILIFLPANMAFYSFSNFSGILKLNKNDVVQLQSKRSTTDTYIISALADTTLLASNIGYEKIEE
jgi:hypothetical protein